MKWRLLDTGKLTAAENIALDEVLLEIRAKGRTPNTVRFLQFYPPAVLVGYHQSVEQEIRLEFCHKKGIEINRRITGGGAIYFDPTQIGWEIISDKRFFNISVANPHFFQKLSEPLIYALKQLGIKANFRPRNDIEVNGRKISGTGGTEMGNAFLFQGTLLVDFDVDTMLRTLHIPIEKLKAKEIESAKERVTCLKWEIDYLPKSNDLKRLLKDSFEKVFKMEFSEGGLTEEERCLFRERANKFKSNTWIDKIRLPKDEQPTVFAAYKAEGGVIKVFLAVNLRYNRIQSAIIMGDFFVYPKRTIFDLEALLKDTAVDKKLLENKIGDFFEVQKPQIPGIKPDDFIKTINKAIEKLKLIKFDIPPSLSNHLFLVNGSFEEVINKNPSFLLLPYCAKSLDCGYRYKKDCPKCDKCSIGEGYRIGREHNLEVTTITSFEDLINTLKGLKKRGVGSYIGCCCEAFYTKHIEEFEKAELPGILIDINNTTCYDLDKVRNAYQGHFESQTELNIQLLKKVLDVL